MMPQPALFGQLAFGFVLNDVHRGVLSPEPARRGGSSEQVEADMFDLGDRQRPGGSFYFLHEKGIEHATFPDTKCHRTVPAAGPTRPNSRSPETFPAVHQGGTCLRAPVSTQSASTGVMNHRTRTTG